MKFYKFSILTLFLAVTLLIFKDVSAESWGKYQAGDRRSGYTYATLETRAIQDDDFANPAFLWFEVGEAQWNKVQGSKGKSCASCHGEAELSMAHVGSSYPKFDIEKQRPINVELRINKCRTEHMGAKAFKYESKDMLGTTIYVKAQARGSVINTDFSGAMLPWFEKGKTFYYQRRGQLDMSCANCHEENAGNMIRANRLSEGQVNGFPTFRLKWQKPGSLHRRFRGCNKQVRATPYKYGSDEYLALETYVMYRARNLPVETPAVRN